MLNLGALVVLSHVSHVYVEVVPIAPVRRLLATCAVEVTCSHPRRSTGGGIARSALLRSDTPLFRPLVPPASLLSSWPKVALIVLPTISVAFVMIMMSIFTSVRVYESL